MSKIRSIVQLKIFSCLFSLQFSIHFRLKLAKVNKKRIKTGERKVVNQPSSLESDESENTVLWGFFF